MSKKDPSQNLCCFQDRQEPVHPSQNQHTDSEWQFLSELEVPVGSDAEQRVAVWLTKSLKTLDLPEDFVNKILKSAQDAMTRLTRVESVMNIEHIHVCLFIPQTHTQESQFWGFFRAEKVMDTAEDTLVHGQMIAFYLYLEG